MTFIDMINHHPFVGQASTKLSILDRITGPRSSCWLPLLRRGSSPSAPKYQIDTIHSVFSTRFNHSTDVNYLCACDCNRSRHLRSTTRPRLVDAAAAACSFSGCRQLHGASNPGYTIVVFRSMTPRCYCEHFPVDYFLLADIGLCSGSANAL